MPVLDKILRSDIISIAWRKILLSIRDGRLTQLVTLKPLDVYKNTMPYEIEGAQMKVNIDARLENLIQKPIQKALDFLSLDFKSDNSFFSYDVHVDVGVSMDFENMEIYLYNQYANKQYWILDDRIGLTFKSFHLKLKNRQIEVSIPLQIDAKYKKLKYDGVADVYARGFIFYDEETATIKIIDISYVATSEKFILRMASLFYYKEIVKSLEDFMQFNLKPELDEGLVLLKKAVKDYNSEFKMLSGEIETLQLKNLQIVKNGGVGNFKVKGKIKVVL